MKLAFWGCVGLIGYAYLGYPLWLYLRSRWRPKSVRAARITPTVSIVMTAYNEASALPEKLRNLVRLNYPEDRLEVIVVSDGSTDTTNQILAAHASEHFRFLALSENEGKASALNRGIEMARGDIVVFTDARQFIDCDAVLRLVANFADSSVGCVSGELTLVEPRRGGLRGEGLGLYWRIEKKIRKWESATSSVVGATGALYAVRKELLVPLPAGTLLDDVYLPFHVARQGKRVVFEPRARAFDALAPWQREFRRKLRTLVGNYQLVQLAPWLLTRGNPVRFEFVSHKLLRLVVPFALATIFAGSVSLKGTFYGLAAVLQSVFYGLAGMAVIRPRLGIFSRVAEIALAFVVLNTAAALALVLFLKGKREIWVR